MNCERVQELLADYLGGEASAADRAELEAHIASCTACRAEVVGLSATVGVMRTLDTVPLEVAAARTHGLRVVRVRPVAVRLVFGALRTAAMIAVGMVLGWYLGIGVPAPADTGRAASPGSGHHTPPDSGRTLLTDTQHLEHEPMVATAEVHQGWIELGREVGAQRSSFVRDLAVLARARSR